MDGENKVRKISAHVDTGAAKIVISSDLCYDIMN